MGGFQRRERTERHSDWEQSVGHEKLSRVGNPDDPGAGSLETENYSTTIAVLTDGEESHRDVRGLHSSQHGLTKARFTKGKESEEA